MEETGDLMCETAPPRLCVHFFHAKARRRSFVSNFKTLSVLNTSLVFIKTFAGFSAEFACINFLLL